MCKREQHNVASKKDSLCVKWVNMYRLKERSVWDISVDGNANCGWRKIMELRDDVRPHIRHCLGNGQSTMFGMIHGVR